MDESKEYIDMCKKLPENIKQDFENVYPIDGVGSVCILDDGEIGYIGTHLSGWQCHGYDCSGENIPIIQLYTQDQLQDIVNVYNFHSLSYVTTQIESKQQYIGYWCKFLTQEQFWLSWVMCSKYGKKWNGKEWV